MCGDGNGGDGGDADTGEQGRSGQSGKLVDMVSGLVRLRETPADCFKVRGGMPGSRTHIILLRDWAVWRAWTCLEHCALVRR